MVVFRSASANATRILASLTDVRGNPLTAAPLQLDAGPSVGVLSNPSVAWNGRLYLVVWSNSAGVVGQRLSFVGSEIDPNPFVIMAAAYGTPDVAAVGDDFLVTGRKTGASQHTVFPVAARVRGSDGVVLDPSPLALGFSYVRAAPVVTALGKRWLVAWHRNATHDNSAAGSYAIWINADGTRTTEFNIHPGFSTSGGNGIFSIGLASNGSKALFVQSQELTSGVETDLTARFINADGTLTPLVNLTPWEGNQYSPKVAWDGRHFVVAYQDQRARVALWTLDQLDARSDLIGMRIAPTGAILDPQGFVFSALETAETDPTLAASDSSLTFVGSVIKALGGMVSYRLELTALGGANQWPVAVATAAPNAGDIPLVVSFNSTGSLDPDGSIASYTWDFGDGTTSTQANPIHTYTTPGPFVAFLTVKDNLGAQTRQRVSVNAVNPNALPVAAGRAVPTTGQALLDVILYADGSYDPDGFIGNIQWEFSDGGEYWGAVAYHTFETPGTHTATLTVYDSRGATASTIITIVVH
jgi:PKD repeat protein